MANIVVVDDDPVLRRVMTLALEGAGHKVLRCENGKKAIDSIIHDDVDLLITDILMPEMDGIETLREARKIRPDLPIIAVSGSKSFDPVHYLGFAQAFGATAVLPKPFPPKELVGLVATLLGE